MISYFIINPAVPLLLAGIVQLFVSVKGGMCGAMTQADKVDDYTSLLKKAVANLRSACRNGNPKQACHFSTVPHPKPYSYMFILEPQIAPFTLNFSVKAYGASAMVGLSEARTDQSVVIEILFGYYPSGRRIAVRRCMPHLCGSSGTELALYEDTSPVISETEYRSFWIHYDEGVVTAGKGGQKESLVEWDAGAYHGRVSTQLHIGISTWEKGYGEWDFCQNM